MRRTCLLLALATGCSGEYAVRVAFDSPGLRAEATRIEVAIVESCPAAHVDGPLNALARTEFAIDAQASALGEVDPGTYGLVGRAWNERCEVIAYSCRTSVVEANGNGTLSVTLGGQSGRRCRTDQACAASVCGGGGDAEVRDASEDVPDDVRPSDAGPDAPDVPDECAGQGDGTTCAEGSGGCHGERCCVGCIIDGLCVEGTDSGACGFGGNECVTCLDDGRPRCAAGTCQPPVMIVKVIVGVDTTHAIDSEGHAWVWGGSAPESQTGRAAGVSPLPELIDFDGRVVDLQVNGLSSGDGATTRVGCLLDGDGKIHCWGYGWRSVSDEPIPITLFDFGEPFEGMALAASDADALPTVYAWTSSGQLHRLGSEFCGDTSGPDWTAEESTLSVEVADAGATHLCALDGAGLYCFGRDDANLLFIGPPPTDRCVARTSMPLHANIVQVSAGLAHTCVRSTDGGYTCFGNNRYGEAGEPTLGTLAYDRPDAFIPGPITDISAGAVHTCALTDGRVYCWGCSTYGRLGGAYAEAVCDGESASPVPSHINVGDVPIESVDVGVNHACGVTMTSGRAYCWGRNLGGSVSGSATHTDGTVGVTILPATSVR